MTGVEKILITFILTVLGSVIVHYFTAKNRVTQHEFNEANKQIRGEIESIKTSREKAWASHSAFCPEKRDLMSEKDHEDVCRKNLAPILLEIKEIKDTNSRIEKSFDKMADAVALMAKSQAQMVTASQLREMLISGGIVNPFGMGK